ncbi:hypothetical protein [Cellulomonas xiejunii]|uniref:hypothetical protein n=1 Tax=Cellulomonas xiejunii TaxID=2968083 RepID=UPI001D0E022F|nr:hypothetical protein [Cellulomonas xiejunii]MCC2313608.1 hypothetical protein [Cellulomonas xiejunii]
MGVTVGVLLPLRLETRFGPGVLRLRVIPDEPWFARHDPRVSAGELDAVQRYVDATTAATTDPLRDLAWRDLAAATGGARAVFLVRSVVVTAPDGAVTVRAIPPEALREDPAFPRIEGFPERLHVWLARAGAAPTEVMTLDVRRERLLTDFPDPDQPGERRWWEQWDEAVLAGLAGEIPLPGDPSDIDVLYVTGLGDEPAGDLFADHRDNGRLGLLAPGEPTNSVAGRPAAPFGQDPMSWRSVLQAPPAEVARQVSAALTGDADLLGALPGSTDPHREPSTAMVAALWPALWGFASEDVWATPDVRAWAADALLPEGPFPTLRIGPQPYGLLPVSALERWAADAADPGVEASVIPSLLRLRGWYAAAAEARGTVVGASTDDLLDLIGQLPVSPVFRYRHAWPLELWWQVLVLIGYPVTWKDIDGAWRARHKEAEELGLSPARRYGTAGAPLRLTMPLVTPNRLPEGMTFTDALKRLLEIAEEQPWVYGRTEMLEREFLRFGPDSLLLRLVIRSLQVSIGDIGREKAGEDPPGLEPVAGGVPGRLQAWIESVTPQDLHTGTAGSGRYRVVLDALIRLLDLDVARLERQLRVTVDTAVYRIDPWLTGPPTRRLSTLLAAGDADMRLGAYGWVDRPRPGTPGPTAAGMIHTPSPDQALAATVLRDRAVNDGSARWDLDLTSRVVRDADRIAEHVRVGAHLSEALGREVERVVGRVADIERLRREFPVRTEHAGRRVCDGLAVLAAPAATLGLDADRLAGLERLREAMDAYGDLLVAEATYDITQGRADVAGAVLDAAAGLSRPPRLEILRTHRQGRAVTTRVVVMLPAAADPVLPEDPFERATMSPGTLADPSVAAFLRARLGPAHDWVIGTATLADLGLQPVDALALTVTDLRRLGGDVGGPGLDIYEAGARLVAVIGRNPAGPDTLAETSDVAPDPLTELLARYARVRGTLVALLDQMDAALGLAPPDPLVLGRLVVAARGWGVAPDPRPDPLTDRLTAVAGHARDVLRRRLDAAAADVSALERGDLLAALAALVSPTGQIAITATLPPAVRPALTRDSTLATEWLPVIAAVRERLAHVEAGQLDGGAPFTAWTNKPGDPWQTQAGDTRRQLVAYAPAGTDLSAADPLAVAAVDDFAEFVPDEQQTTAVTFGFDAPSARAPQAILLAVPPDLAVPLDDRALVETVVGTRELAHARVARPADLAPGLRGMQPSALLPASGATAVPLEPRS